jgi:hypothetical protein
VRGSFGLVSVLALEIGAGTLSTGRRHQQRERKLFFSKKSKTDDTKASAKRLPEVCVHYCDPRRLPLSSGQVVGTTRFDFRIRCAELEFSGVVRALPDLIRRASAALPRSPGPSTDRDRAQSLVAVLKTADVKGLEAKTHDEVAGLFQSLFRAARSGDETDILLRVLELEIHTDKMVFQLSSVAAAMLELNRNPWGAADEFYKPKARTFAGETLNNSKAAKAVRAVYGFHIIEENIRLCGHFARLVEASIAEIEASPAA